MQGRRDPLCPLVPPGAPRDHLAVALARPLRCHTGSCPPGPGQHGPEEGAAVPGVPNHPGGAHGPAGQPQPQAQHGSAPALRHLRWAWAPRRPPGIPVLPPWHPLQPPNCPPGHKGHNIPPVLAQGDPQNRSAEVSPEPWGDPLSSPPPTILFWAWIAGWGCHLCHLCVTAVMDITDITKGTCDSDEDKQHFIPVHP